MISNGNGTPSKLHSDVINRAFEHAQTGGASRHSVTSKNMDGWNGRGGAASFSHHDDDDEEEDDDDDVFQPRKDLVTDYRCEVPEEEGEGHAYNIEKRHIRETVDLADSFVFVWGDGKFGKLGHQSLDTLYVPYVVSALQRISIRMCALGKQHTLFLSTDGYVMSSGSSAYGQLGNGDDTEIRSTPVLVQSISDIRSIAAGHYHSMALTNMGKIFTWGSGSWGKLGTGSDSNFKVPRLVAPLQSMLVDAIACGAHHSTCLTASGDVWTWGKGMRGQLGHNSCKEEYSPRLMAMLRKKGAERIRCGEDHTLILLRTGQVYAVGGNSHGQLGLGDTLDRGLPVLIPSLQDEQISDLTCGSHMSLVLTNAGKVIMFGDAKDNALAEFRTPKVIPTLPKFDPTVAIGVAGHQAYAVSDTGNLYRWTINDIDLDKREPMEPFHAIKGVVRIYCGINHFAAICTPDMGCTQTMVTRDKATSMSSDISRASLEKVPDDPVLPPMQAMPEVLDDIASDVLTESPSREGDGFLLTYGKGVFGRLGHGIDYTLSEESLRLPKKVETLAKASIIEVVCGKDSTACLTDTGRLYTWGKSVTGKLGLGRVNGNVVVPQRLDYFASRVVSYVSLGRNHGACVTDDSRVYSWGSNTFGQLGLPHITTYIGSPQELSSLRETNVCMVACGGWHTLTCTWAGDVYSCGKGWHGQLGQGDYESLTAQSKTLPYFKKIVCPAFQEYHVVKVFGGKEMSGALTDQGKVFTWGQGDRCQLGHDSTNNEAEPRLLDALSKVRIVDLAMGFYHMLALDEKGVPYSWGQGQNGQLGLGELGEKERLPRPIELCRRVSRGLSGFDRKQRDMEWGSFYFKKERIVREDGPHDGEEEEKEIEYRQRGKVVMIAANGSYSLFVLERLANEAEILAYNIQVQKKLTISKKMTNMTVIRELFGCGSGKGGVLQSVGKESEYLPKIMLEQDSGELLQDIIKISAGKAHVGIIVREDHLRNVESKNMDEMRYKDLQANKLRERDILENQLLEITKQHEEKLANDMHRAEQKMNPFTYEIESSLDAYLSEIPGFDHQKWLPRLIENGVDKETLSTLHTDDDLKLVGISAIGARRRLLKEIPKLPKRYPPVFYAYCNSEFFYISWPPNKAEEIAKKQVLDKYKSTGNPFAEFLKRKAGGKIFRSMVRYAEMKHFESIKDRANLRYQRDPEGQHKLLTWGVGLNGRLGHGYGIAYATPHPVNTLPPKAKVVEVACGCEHTLIRTYDGSVMTCGNGDRGQLGTTENYYGVGVNVAYTPQTVGALKRYFIVCIAAGRWHNMVITSDRNVYVWGSGHFGQLGLDANETKGIPQHLKALDGRAACKALCGGWHSAVVTETGKFMVWGKNTHGQLGFNDTRTCNYPRINKYLRREGKVRTGAMGANHTLVVMVDNRVFSFGQGESGQLGHDGKNSMLEPHEVQTLNGKNICEVAAGDQHSLALSVFGEVWAWGGSLFGQLGHGGIMDITVPTPLLERHNIPPNVKHIACGYTFSMALTSNGEVYSWGQGESGELGHAPKVLAYAPMQIHDLSKVEQIACGHRHAAAVQFTPRLLHLQFDGTAEALKFANAQMAGDAMSEMSGSRGESGTTTPRSVSTRHSSFHAMQSQKKHGYVYAWGEDTCGQLGMRGLQGSRSPTLMQNMAGLDIVEISVSGEMTALVTKNGKVMVCGSGEFGRLGLGHTAPAPTPMEIRYFSHANVTISSVACGSAHALALSEDRRVYAWGDGTWGNTGVYNSTEVKEPTELHSLSAFEIERIAAGGFHSAAVTMDGMLFTWGKNSNGQLGQGTVTIAEESPKKVESIGGNYVTDVQLGLNHTAIIVQSTPPNVFTCGMNANGQLGQGDCVDRCDPTAVVALDDRQLISISCGAAHTACISQFGDLITWGCGRNGQLGVFSGIDSDHILPVQLPSFCENKLIKVVCGNEITAVLTDIGEVYICGRESGTGIGGSQAKDLVNPTIPKEVEGLTGVQKIAFGSVHGVALVSSTLDLTSPHVDQE